ncbi:MAG: zinc-dependent metalloprotease family protein [Halioglobus sp.]
MKSATIFGRQALALLTILAGMALTPSLAFAEPEKVFREKPRAEKPGRHGTMKIKGEANTGAFKRNAETVSLELPDGTVVELERKSFKRHRHNKATWRGKVKGHNKSEATLSIVGEQMAGRLVIDEKVYEIRPAANRETSVEWLDMSSFPACDGGVISSSHSDSEDEVSINLAEAMALAAAADEANPQIELLVLYDDAALLRVMTENGLSTTEEAVLPMETIVAAAVASLNTALSNSDMTATVTLAHTGKISHSETDGGALLSWLANDAGVADLRNLHNADLVSVITDLPSFCGIGNLQRTTANSFYSGYAFQVSDIDCAVGNLTFAHETGHNFGMEHNPENSDASIHSADPRFIPSYEHSFGHWVTGGSNPFRTVMSYGDPCIDSACPRLPYFSNPDINYFDTPTGVIGTPGTVDGKDNAQTGDFTTPAISLFRGATSSPYNILQMSDDAQEQLSTGVVGVNWTQLWTGSYPLEIDSEETTLGLRFQAIQVPKDATITAAWLEFTAVNSRSSNSSSSISLQDADSPATFTSANGDITSRATTGNVPWDITSPWVGGTHYNSADISALVQAAVDRDGWIPSQSMAFMIGNTSGERHMYSQEGAAIGDGPRLHIEHRVCDESITLAGGTWHLISLPCETSANTVSEIFTGLSPLDYGTVWGVFSHNAVNNSYSLLAHTEAIAPNAGYWYINNAASYELNVAGTESRNTVIPLHADATIGAFNLIGHAGKESIPWDKVKIFDGDTEYSPLTADPDLGIGIGLACDQLQEAGSQCLMSRKLYKRLGGNYSTFDGISETIIGSIEPFEGAWVKVFKPGLTLHIPVTADEPVADVVSDSAEDSAEDSLAIVEDNLYTHKHHRGRPWSMQLIVDSGKQFDIGTLGQLTTSANGKDAHDLEELAPYSDSWLSLVFINDRWPEDDKWGYASDFRTLKKQPIGMWRFVVRASEEQKEATLRWDGPYRAIKRARLVDVETGKTIRLKKRNSYTFPITEGEHAFRLEIR